MIATYTGKLIDPLNCQPEDICIKDIAHGLSLLCRYGGQCNRFYSVAEHSILMAVYSHLPGHPLGKLLHDAAEAYIGDLIRPVKQKLPDFEKVESHIFDCITNKFHLNNFKWAPVKESDDIMLATEGYRMMNIILPFANYNLVDFNMPFYYFTPLEAERRFLQLYKELAI